MNWFWLNFAVAVALAEERWRGQCEGQIWARVVWHRED